MLENEDHEEHEEHAEVKQYIKETEVSRYKLGLLLQEYNKPDYEFPLIQKTCEVINVDKETQQIVAQHSHELTVGILNLLYAETGVRPINMLEINIAFLSIMDQLMLCSTSLHTFNFTEQFAQGIKDKAITAKQTFIVCQAITSAMGIEYLLDDKKFKEFLEYKLKAERQAKQAKHNHKP